ncbi:MAG: RNA ligase family protein [Nitrospiria bacterium]
MIDVSEEFGRFEDFPKIYRWSRECIITEKIDGTNAQVNILPDGRVLAGSKNRYITPEADNFGFARWVKDHEDELRQGLGFGRHFGEWWGPGIQRGYGLKEKKFSLFNTTRWKELTSPRTCWDLVPILYQGPFGSEGVEGAMALLEAQGSQASPGFMRPEGIVVFHTQGHFLLKKTFEKDQEGKG